MTFHVGRCHSSASFSSKERLASEEDSGSATSSPSDWTKWNIGSSLQILRAGSPAATLRELRKLHLRWWHATAQQLQNTLRAAGLPQSTLDACVPIVNTCKQCRAFERPGRQTEATLTLTTRFNEIVETDISCVFSTEVQPNLSLTTHQAIF